MTKRILEALSFVVMTSWVTSGIAQASLEFADISSCDFANGVRIAPCRIAYRSFGTLSAAGDNAVLIPTWLLGRSEEWTSFLGPEGIVDPTVYYVVVVDALSDGQSQSPSNTTGDGRRGFDAMTIGDMVESQYRLLTEKLGIQKLHAVVGYSMGGIQAIEWSVRYPMFMDRVVAMAGSPRLGAYDHLVWSTMQTMIDDGVKGRLPADNIWQQLSRLDALNSRTPRAVNAVTPAELDQEVAKSGAIYRDKWALEDYRAQIAAVLRHDVAANYDGDLEKAASRVRAKMMLVYSWDDHMLTAESVEAFGRLAGAEMLELPTPCGHMMGLCETARIGSEVRAFLAQ